MGRDRSDAVAPGARAHWQVEAAGIGAPAIVLFPGALGRAETLRPALERLSRRARTLALGYPPGRCDPELVAGDLDEILANEACERAHFVGFSLGAQVARDCAWLRPARCASLVLVGAGAPDRARAARIARVLPLLRWLPAPILRARWRRELERLLRGPRPEVVAARDRLLALLATMPRRELVAARERLVALDASAIAGAPVRAETRTLRIELDLDEVISAEERERLAALAPHAEVARLPGLGHGATLVLPPELLERIETWCER